MELNLRKQRQWFLLDVSNSAGGVRIRQQELRIRGLLAFCLHIPRFILLFLRWKSIIRCTTTPCCSDVWTRLWEEAILHIISRFSIYPNLSRPAAAELIMESALSNYKHCSTNKEICFPLLQVLAASFLLFLFRKHILFIITWILSLVCNYIVARRPHSLLFPFLDPKKTINCRQIQTLKTNKLLSERKWSFSTTISGFSW